MGFFDDPSSIVEWSNVANALAQAAMPTRMPTPMGAVIGGAAGAMGTGMSQAQQYLARQQQLAAGGIGLGQQMDRLRATAQVLGLPPPDFSSIASGKWQGLTGSMPQPGQSPVPTAPLGGAQPTGAIAQPTGQPRTSLADATDAIWDIESGGRTSDVPDSKAGAIGPFQITPATGKTIGLTEDQLRNDPTNIAAGKQMIAGYFDQYGGDPSAVAVAYDAGPAMADKWLNAGKDNSILPQETQNYLAQLHTRLGTNPVAPTTPVTATALPPGAASMSPAAGAAPGGMFGAASAFGAAPVSNSAFNAPTNAMALALTRGRYSPTAGPGAAPTLPNGQPVGSFGGAAPAAASGSPAPGSPGYYDALRASLMRNMMARQYLLGMGATPVEQNLFASSMYPQGSAPARMLGAAADKAAGISPYMGGERPGVPLREYNPQTGGYDIIGQNPRTDAGQIMGQNGSIGYAPGYLPAAQQGIAARAAAENTAKYGDLYMPTTAGTPSTLGLPVGGAPVSMQTAQTNLTARLTKPVATDRGTLIPPLAQQGQLGSPAQLEAAIPAWQKTVTTWNEAVAPAQQAEQRLWTIAHAFGQIQSGKWQEVRGDVQATMNLLGLPTNLTDASQVETALHENYLQTLTRLKATTSRFTQSEFRIVSENSEHPDLQPAANLQMLSEDLATLRRAQYLPADWAAAQSLGWRNPQSFESAWAAANPLGKTVQNVRDLIGPLKGMPGYQPPTGQQLGQGQVPAVPQIAHDANGREIIARDGKWFWRDSGQPLQPSAPIARP